MKEIKESVMQSATTSPNAQTETHATKTENPADCAAQPGGVSSPVPCSAGSVVAPYIYTIYQKFSWKEIWAIVWRKLTGESVRIRPLDPLHKYSRAELKLLKKQAVEDPRSAF